MKKNNDKYIHDALGRLFSIQTSDEVETDLKQGTLGYWQTHLLLGVIAYKYPEFRPVYDLIYGYNLANDNLNETFLTTWAIDSIYRDELMRLKK